MRNVTNQDSARPEHPPRSKEGDISEQKVLKDDAPVDTEIAESSRPATRTKAAPGKRPEELERQASLVEITREKAPVNLMQPSTDAPEAEADSLELKRQISEIDLLGSPAPAQDDDKQDGEMEMSFEAASAPPDRPAAAPGQGPWKRSRNKACVSLDDDSGDEAPVAKQSVVELDDR